MGSTRSPRAERSQRVSQARPELPLRHGGHLRRDRLQRVMEERRAEGVPPAPLVRIDVLVGRIRATRVGISITLQALRTEVVDVRTESTDAQSVSGITSNDLSRVARRKTEDDQGARIIPPPAGSARAALGPVRHDPRQRDRRRPTRCVVHSGFLYPLRRPRGAFVQAPEQVRGRHAEGGHVASMCGRAPRRLGPGERPEGLMGCRAPRGGRPRPYSPRRVANVTRRSRSSRPGRPADAGGRSGLAAAGSAGL